MTIVTRQSDGLKGRVLIIDDDTATLAVLSKALSREAFDVECASSARDALTRLTRSDFDIIISDIRMPEFDGRQLFAFIQDHFPDYAARVIFLTGDSAEDTQEFIASTRALHFTKPPDLRQLIETVHAMVGSRRAADEPAAMKSAAVAVSAPAGIPHNPRLEVEAAQLRRELADRDRHIQDLATRLDRASHEVSAARLQATTASDEMNALRDEIASKERELSRMARRAERAEADAATERETLHTELDRVRRQLAQAVTEVETLRSDLGRRDAELHAARQEHGRRETDLQARLQRAMTAAAEADASRSAAAQELVGAPVAAADEGLLAEMEQLIVNFYRTTVRPLTIMSAHLEMAAGTSDMLDAEAISELNGAVRELKQGLAELARKMEALGIKPASA